MNQSKIDVNFFIPLKCGKHIHFPTEKRKVKHIVKYSLWIGLNVCELTECSPVRCWTLCNLCRNTFSDLVDDDDDESFNESIFESIPKTLGSSVCVALSSCNIVYADTRCYSINNIQLETTRMKQQQQNQQYTKCN